MQHFSQNIKYSNTFYLLSVNAISWASPDYGLMLACGSSDGSISILSSSGLYSVLNSFSESRFVSLHLT